MRAYLSISQSLNLSIFQSFNLSILQSPRLRLLGAPRLERAVDLLRVFLQVLGVTLEPVFGGVAARLAVRALRRPRRLRHPAQETDGVRPHHVHGRERQLDAR